MQVGDRIKELRIRQGLTVGALADKTGLSKGLVSQVENDKTSPSLATLERLAEGLDVPVAFLLLKSAEGIQVVRRNDRSIYAFGPDEIRVEVLSGTGQSNLKAVMITFPPGTSTGCSLHAHGGEEFHLVLEGQIEAHSGATSTLLEEGDSFHWKSCTPHRIVNIGDSPARILAVTSSSVAELIGEAIL